MIIDGEFEIESTREDLYRHIINAELMAGCIPGCESLEQISPNSYRARVTIGLGSIKAAFNLVVEITKENPPESVFSVTRGEEGGKASTVTANNEVYLVDLGNGVTKVRYVSDVSVTGRLGKFALGVMKKKAQSMGKEFADNLCVKLQAKSGIVAGEGETVAAPAALAPGFLRKLLDIVKIWWQRLRS